MASIPQSPPRVVDRGLIALLASAPVGIDSLLLMAVLFPMTARWDWYYAAHSRVLPIEAIGVFAALAYLLGVAYLTLDYFGRARDTTTARLVVLGLLVVNLVVAPMVTSIVVRHVTGQTERWVHDTPLQIEAAVDALLHGHNPYATDYADTPLARWPYYTGPLWSSDWQAPAPPEARVNPAIYHVAYLPFTLLVTAPLQALSTWTLGWFDGRWSNLLAYLFTLGLLSRLLRDRVHRLAALARRLLPTALTALAITLPFLAWDWRAFLEDTVGYISGVLPTSYPLSGMGIGGIAVVLGWAPNAAAPFPASLLQALVAGPFLVALLRTQWRFNTLRHALAGYAVFLLVFMWLARFYFENYLGYILLTLSVAAFWPADDTCAWPPFGLSYLGPDVALDPIVPGKEETCETTRPALNAANPDSRGRPVRWAASRRPGRADDGPGGQADGSAQGRRGPQDRAHHRAGRQAHRSAEARLDQHECAGRQGRRWRPGHGRQPGQDGLRALDRLGQGAGER